MDAASSNTSGGERHGPTTAGDAFQLDLADFDLSHFMGSAHHTQHHIPTTSGSSSTAMEDIFRSQQGAGRRGGSDHDMMLGGGGASGSGSGQHQHQLHHQPGIDHPRQLVMQLSALQQQQQHYGLQQQQQQQRTNSLGQPVVTPETLRMQLQQQFKLQQLQQLQNQILQQQVSARAVFCCSLSGSSTAAVLIQRLPDRSN